MAHEKENHRHDGGAIIADHPASDAARGSRTPCPQCGTVGRMVLEPGLLAKPPTAQALAGMQVKTAAVETLFIRCESCQWRAAGEIEADGKFTVSVYAVNHASSGNDANT